MSKISGALCTLSAITLWAVSCSPLLQNRSNNSPTLSDPIADINPMAQSTDSLPSESSVEIIAADSTLCPEADSLIFATDSLAVDSIFLEHTIPIEQEYEIFHFEGKDTYSVMIDEFRNTVVADLNIDLSAEDSFYPADGHVTSNYGWRKGRMHAGIDLKAYTGDNLYAAFDGVVRLSKYYSSFGNCIIIRHYNGLETLYAHASKRFVEVNDVVKAGDVIALAGNTGRSTGSHLHFEVRAGGHYLNPTLILDTKNRKIKDANLYITMRNGRLFASNNDSEEEREAYILQQISIRYHTVKSGDNLSRIAANNGTTVATLCRLNGISSKSILRIGQRLIVRDGITPPAKSTASSSSATKSNANKSASSSTNTSSTSDATLYKVRSGDNLSYIAKRYGTTVSAICTMNNISSTSTLRVGQKLRIPSQGGSTAAATSTTSEPEYYRIKSGDTLSHIAKRYGTSVTALCRLNNISKEATLRINQRIRVR